MVDKMKVNREMNTFLSEYAHEYLLDNKIYDCISIDVDMRFDNCCGNNATLTMVRKNSDPIVIEFRTYATALDLKDKEIELMGKDHNGYAFKWFCEEEMSFEVYLFCEKEDNYVYGMKKLIISDGTVVEDINLNSEYGDGDDIV